MKAKRKNNLSTLARILFALVMVLGIAVGNVYAKYITQEESDPEDARVAAWGIEITVTDSNLFGSRYVYEGPGSAVTPNVDDDRAEVIVANDSSSYLVAPGAKGSMSFTVTGNAEVASKLSFDVSSAKDILLSGTLTDASSNVRKISYAPLIWTIKKDTVTLRTGSLTYCLGGLEEATFNPNASINSTFEISWRWPYEEEVSDTRMSEGRTYIDYDQADTLLSLLTYDDKNGTNRASTYVDGYTFAKDSSNVLTSNLVFKIIVEQVD